jgi:hypothetical protein
VSVFKDYTKNTDKLGAKYSNYERELEHTTFMSYLPKVRST